MVFQSWGDALTTSLLNVWFGVASFVPKLVLALVIFAIGWILAVLVEKLVEHLFRSLRVDAFLRSAGFDDVVKRAGHTLNSGMFVGVMVKWFIIVVFLMAAFDTLNLVQVTIFLNQVVTFLPNVIVAVLILMVAVIIASAMQKVVMASARAAHIKSAELLGRITKWSIWIFAILVALSNLGIATGIIYTVVQMTFAGLALAVGLAFGLGGKDVARELIEKTAHSVLEKE